MRYHATKYYKSRLKLWFYSHHNSLAYTNDMSMQSRYMFIISCPFINLDQTPNHLHNIWPFSEYLRPVITDFQMHLPNSTRYLVAWYIHWIRHVSQPKSGECSIYFSRQINASRFIFLYYKISREAVLNLTIGLSCYIWSSMYVLFIKWPSEHSSNIYTVTETHPCKMYYNPYSQDGTVTCGRRSLCKWSTVYHLHK